MMTPFEIKDRVEEITLRRKRLYPHDTIGRARIARDLVQLYREVLHEIAKGSLDARSLAIAAIAAETEVPK